MSAESPKELETAALKTEERRSRKSRFPLLLWCAAVLVTALMSYALLRMYPGTPPVDEVLAAFLLNLFNGSILLFLTVKRNFGTHLDALSASMGILVSKLFVNTFTIFLLIGLKAMDARVFVPMFFAGYVLHLVCGIGGMHLATTQERRSDI